MDPPSTAVLLLPPLILALAGAACGVFTVWAWPRVAVVPYGGSVAINCSRSACPLGNTTLGLDTPLLVALGATGHQWQSFWLLNVSQWNPGKATCYGQCGDSQGNASAEVLVYRLPDQVLLDPLPPLPMGESQNLTCHVLEVAPVVNLTVTLRRGADTLRTVGFGAVNGSTNVTVTHVLSAGPEDHGQDVTCHAELSLRPHGPLFASAAVPIRLSVFALPEPPELQAPSHMELGTTGTASCQVTGAFPIADVGFTITMAGQSLNVTTTVVGDVLTSITRLVPSMVGALELVCTVTVATAARTARRLIHVYRFPAPILELSPVPAPAGTEVLVLCRIDAAEPPALWLQLRDADNGILAEGPHSQLELPLVAGRGDDRRRFRCRASLDVDGNTVTKDVDNQLSVLYMPDLAVNDCPGIRTWLQGTWEALSCHATGNPIPTVSCGRDGVTISTTVPELVTRSRAGTYICNATNSLGTQSRLVTVNVEYEPTLTERGCPTHRLWVEGEQRELSCRADGDPAPSTHCTRDDGTTGGRLTTQQRVVDRGDAGSYTCRASNKHGTAERSVVVTVEYKPSMADPGCPSQRLWVEGTPAELLCAATGNPQPHVTCTKLGDGYPPMTTSTNVTRAHAGTYQCQATNSRGSALRNVTITVEYSPTTVTLRVLPSAAVSSGTSLSVECRADGLPPPTYGWVLPPAPNLRFGTGNHSVTITGAGTVNGGVYTCTASNRHGWQAGSIMVRVDENRLVLVASLGSVGAITAVGLVAAGGYYLKSTACKKGEYNVRDAEGTLEAACLHRQHHGQAEVYGIQLTQP
ncbi:intercellular adhesion molecule 5-like [Melopsittacus undulatus]|uniref:intercellular adhesion molecule 5-like n=1 Tax=Melopsittacus undulatus TaxID=13146 RepID=UPI00146A089D|nr:intercellular adhesion molecule 5-like [Melopsittacus undulatus]